MRNPFTLLLPGVVLAEALPHVSEGLAMELLFGTKDIEDLGGREDGEELVVIGLLDLLQLQLHLVALLHQPLAAGIVGGLDTTLLAHPSEYGALLLLHLTVKREELGTLFGGKTGLLGDKLLHLSLELLRRELLGLIGLTDQDARQKEHHADKEFLHISFHFPLSSFHFPLSTFHFPLSTFH